MPTRGSSSARGLGYAHRRRVEYLFTVLAEGAPCPRCGAPMHRDPQMNFDGRKLQGDHFEVPRAHGGGLPDTLAHARCNESAGAVLGNQMRAGRDRWLTRQDP